MGGFAVGAGVGAKLSIVGAGAGAGTSDFTKSKQFCSSVFSAMREIQYTINYRFSKEYVEWYI